MALTALYLFLNLFKTKKALLARVEPHALELGPARRSDGSSFLKTLSDNYPIPPLGISSESDGGADSDQSECDQTREMRQYGTESNRTRSIRTSSNTILQIQNPINQGPESDQTITKMGIQKGETLRETEREREREREREPQQCEQVANILVGTFYSLISVPESQRRWYIVGKYHQSRFARRKRIGPDRNSVIYNPKIVHPWPILLILDSY
jgi:hypothetical protein